MQENGETKGEQTKSASEPGPLESFVNDLYNEFFGFLSEPEINAEEEAKQEDKIAESEGAGEGDVFQEIWDFFFSEESSKEAEAGSETAKEGESKIEGEKRNESGSKNDSAGRSEPAGSSEPGSKSDGGRNEGPGTKAESRLSQLAAEGLNNADLKALPELSFLPGAEEGFSSGNAEIAARKAKVALLQSSLRAESESVRERSAQEGREGKEAFEEAKNLNRELLKERLASKEFSREFGSIEGRAKTHGGDYLLEGVGLLVLLGLGADQYFRWRHSQDQHLHEQKSRSQAAGK